MSNYLLEMKNICKSFPGVKALQGVNFQLLSGEIHALLGDYPNGGMIHLCGSHTQHLETFRNMKNLKSLQLNDRASEDLALYLEGLRDDQILYVIPCATMPVDKILDISKGERVVLVENCEAPNRPQS